MRSIFPSFSKASERLTTGRMVGRFSTAAGSTGRADSAEVTPSLPLRWNSFPGCLWLHPYPGARKLFLFLPHPFTSGDTFRLPVSETQRSQSAHGRPSPTPGADPEVPCWRAVEAAAGWVQGRPPALSKPLSCEKRYFSSSHLASPGSPLLPRPHIIFHCGSKP